jgi:hypothetical protein
MKGETAAECAKLGVGLAESSRHPFLIDHLRTKISPSSARSEEISRRMLKVDPQMKRTGVIIDLDEPEALLAVPTLDHTLPGPVSGTGSKIKLPINSIGWKAECLLSLSRVSLRLAHLANDQAVPSNLHRNDRSTPMERYRFGGGPYPKRSQRRKDPSGTLWLTYVRACVLPNSKPWTNYSGCCRVLTTTTLARRATTATTTSITHNIRTWG